MPTHNNSPIQLGHIEFLNSLPLLLTDEEQSNLLESTEISQLKAAPALLNEAMLRGELDISPVSSIFYLQNQHRFTLLDQPCIASSKRVKSVLLIIPKNNSGTLALPNTSETSVALSHWYLHQHQINFNQKHYYKPNQALNNIQQGHITLTIGDEALLVDSEINNKDTYNVQSVDLAEAWANYSGLPCVFAVWIAQKEFAQKNPEILKTLSQNYQQKVSELMHNPKHQKALLNLAQQNYPQQFNPNLSISENEHQILNYWLDCLRYDVSDQIHQSLNKMGTDVLSIYNQQKLYA